MWFSSRFETDFSNTGGGFHLEYEIQGCGGILNKPEGSFTSPNYPKTYPHDTHCQWIIEAEYGNLIEITFVDFDFEATIDCAQDGLVVRVFFLKFCLERLKDNFYNSFNNISKLWIQFSGIE